MREDSRLLVGAGVIILTTGVLAICASSSDSATAQADPPTITQAGAPRAVVAATPTSLVHGVDTVIGRPPGTYGNSPAVILVVGNARIPLGGRERFADSAGRLLSKPGTSTLSEVSNSRRADRSYCYSFSGGFLTLDDNDFGLHTAELRKDRPARASRCAPLSAAPHLEIGPAVLSLDMDPSSFSDRLLPGFDAFENSGSKGLKREWWTVDSFGTGPRCATEFIATVAVVRGRQLARIGVTKSGESWKPRSIAGAADSVMSCWALH